MGLGLGVAVGVIAWVTFNFIIITIDNNFLLRTVSLSSMGISFGSKTVCYMRGFVYTDECMIDRNEHIHQK